MARKVTHSEWGRIIANAWIDPTFAHELSLDPGKAVKGFLGLDAKTEVSIFEVPAKPADLSQPQLEDIRSGKTATAFLPPYSC
jgi:hypothetical protein